MDEKPKICYTDAMRALLLFGGIGLYIACAFVPPSLASLHMTAQRVLALKSQHATQFLPSATVLVDTTNVAETVAPIPKTVGTIVASLLHGAPSSSQLSTLEENEKDPILRTQFERIRWAATKGDPRLCKDLLEGSAKQSEGGNPSFGDLLALCLARSTHEAIRCTQMSIGASPSLRAACDEGLDTQG